MKNSIKNYQRIIARGCIILLDFCAYEILFLKFNE